MIRIKINSILLLFLLPFFSCTDEKIIFQDIENQTWLQSESITFKIEEIQSINENTNLILRYSENYPYQNLWIQVSLEPSGSTPKFSRKNIQLAQTDGKWIGKKKGATYSLSVPLTDMECEGSCDLVLVQNMRDERLVGIQSIGLQTN